MIQREEVCDKFYVSMLDGELKLQRNHQVCLCKVIQNTTLNTSLTKNTSCSTCFSLLQHAHIPVNLWSTRCSSCSMFSETGGGAAAEPSQTFSKPWYLTSSLKGVTAKDAGCNLSLSAIPERGSRGLSLYCYYLLDRAWAFTASEGMMSLGAELC